MTENIGGNYYNKYETQNPIARYLVNGFLNSFDSLVPQGKPLSIFEIGCGEGVLAKRLADQGHKVEGVDIESDIISTAQKRYPPESNPRLRFSAQSIYDIQPGSLAAYDLVICCEVFEHLPDPVQARDILAQSGARNILFSVPREPLWRVMNMARGRYIADLGNTPGHLNHWSKCAFKNFIGHSFRIKHVRSPLPWTFLFVTSPE